MRHKVQIMVISQSNLMDEVDAVVIGAGVVGCATARALTQVGLKPWVFEQGPRIAEGVTSRNSGVIHAGIYYPPGSAKAEYCIRGNRMLYDWCEEKGVDFRRCGKWIVGDLDSQADLEALVSNAKQSGAKGLKWGSHSEIEAALPGVRAEIGVYSDTTGIVDAFQFSRSLLSAAEDLGAETLVESQVLGIEILGTGKYLVETSRGAVQTGLIFNCAGLFSDEIAKMVGIFRYRIYPWRGDYFRLNRRFRYSNLIYPVKKKGEPGLGIHLTVGLDGSCRLGPDVEYLGSKTDFLPREDKVQKFLQAGQKYLKDLDLSDLSYESCGIRPKLRAPEDSADPDFVISQDLPGFVNLVGIESPGLTSAMAIAEQAVALATGKGIR